MNKILISSGYFPMIVFSDNKQAYFHALTKGINGEDKKYYHFMMSQMDKSYDLILDILTDILNPLKHQPEKRKSEHREIK